MRMVLLLLFGAAALSACASAGSSNCAGDAFAAGAPMSCTVGASSATVKAVSEILKSPAEYCTAESGFSAGARGEAYAGVCEGEAATAFLSAYGKGEKLLALESGAIAAAQALSDANKDLWQVKRRIMEAETRRLSSMTPRAERRELNIALQSLHEERTTQQADVDRLAKQKSEADRLLAAYRQTLSTKQTVQTVAPASFP